MSTTSSASPHAAFRVVGLTTLAMLAFAGNSLLCRLALGRNLLDAGTFATVRVLSGALLLALLAARLAAGHEPVPRERRGRDTERDWIAAIALAVYLLCFTYAYRWLEAGTGALLLFGAVQLTMF